MKLVVIALVATLAMGFNFDIVAVEDKSVDTGKELPFMDDFRSLSEAFASGNYLNMIPAGMSFLKNVKEYASENAPALNAFLGIIGVQGECPYIKCVREHLCKAGKIGKCFVHALFIGDKAKAKEILKKLDAELNAAIECKKDK